MKQRIILSGMGGQGVISLGNLIGISSMFEDKSVSIVPSYGAEMRGGISNCFVTISDKRIGSPVFSAADVGIFMYQPAMDAFGKNISGDRPASISGPDIRSFNCLFHSCSALVNSGPAKYIFMMPP